MKLTAIAIAVAAIGPAQPLPSPEEPDDGSVSFVMPASEIAKCQAEGGCAIFTRAYIERLQQAAQRCFPPGKEI